MYINEYFYTVYNYIFYCIKLTLISLILFVYITVFGRMVTTDKCFHVTTLPTCKTLATYKFILFSLCNNMVWLFPHNSNTYNNKHKF